MLGTEKNLLAPGSPPPREGNGFLHRSLSPGMEVPLPQPKVGQCPSGYRESGGYCAPTGERAPVAVPKTGKCPSGFVQSGAYCRDTRPRGR
jgi:hypothetical protein